MRMSLRKFIADRRGATVLEYATIAIMVSIVIVFSSAAIGTKLSTLYFGKLIGNF
jgi:Flp pilus assembly pilin Flp